MKSYIILLLIVSSSTFLHSCEEEREITHLKTELVLPSPVYLETYQVYSGGVTGGDVYEYYLTDSVHFREFLMKTFDHHLINVVDLSSRHVLVIKWNRNNLDIEKSTIYDVEDLAKGKVIDL